MYVNELKILKGKLPLVYLLVITEPYQVLTTYNMSNLITYLNLPLSTCITVLSYEITRLKEDLRFKSTGDSKQIV